MKSTYSKSLSLSNIPLKNIKAHPGRSILVIFLITFQALSLLFSFSLLKDMQKELSLSQSRFGADIIVYPYAAMTKLHDEKLIMQGNPICSYHPRSLLTRISENENISKTSFQLYIRDESGKEPIWIVGIEEDKDFVITPWLKNGEKIPLKENEIFAGYKVLAPENKVKLFKKDFPVKARLEKTGSELDSMVFVSIDTLNNLIKLSVELGIDDYKKLNPYKSFSSFLIKTSGKNYVKSVNDWINIHVRKVIAVRSEEALTASTKGIQSGEILTLSISIMLWLVLIAALFIAKSMNVKERKKEFFVWFTVGASSKIISRQIMKESLFEVLPGNLSALVIFTVKSLAFSNMTDFTPLFYILMIIFTLLITLLTGLASSCLSMKITIAKIKGQLLISI